MEYLLVDLSSKEASRGVRWPRPCILRAAQWNDIIQPVHWLRWGSASTRSDMTHTRRPPGPRAHDWLPRGFFLPSAAPVFWCCVALAPPHCCCRDSLILDRQFHCRRAAASARGAADARLHQRGPGPIFSTPRPVERSLLPFHPHPFFTLQHRYQSEWSRNGIKLVRQGFSKLTVSST